ncbi:MAG: ATP-binding protein [Elusimicrobiota bacterium]
MEESRNRGRLSLKLLLWFLLISLVPVGVMGWHLINTSLNVLKDVSIRNQRAMAQRFAENANATLAGFKEALRETVRLGEFADTTPETRERYLERVMQLQPAFLELSVVNIFGQEQIRIGRFQAEKLETRNFYDSPAFQTAIKREEYLGGLERLKGLYPAMTISVPIMETTGISTTSAKAASLSTAPVKGVLMGKVSLAGLTNMLQKELSITDKREAVIAAPDGFIVSHSDPDKVYRLNAMLPENVLKALAERTADIGGGEISLEKGKSVLGGYAAVEGTGWFVYVQQPLESAYHAASRMRRQILRILLWVILITVLLSLAIAAHITLPIRELTQSAEQIAVGRFEDLPELTLTNDEIGDLGQSFLKMTKALHGKTDELVGAKQALEKLKSTLETRVRARTRELDAAQDELVTKERLAAMGQMASVVGHEIRNPLAVINNSIFFIKTKLGKAGRITPQLERHVKMIESEIQQANVIINEILTYSRSRELVLKELSLNKFIADVLAVYPFPGHIEVRKELDARDAAIKIDPDEMRQAMRNLIGNGVEVMPERGTLTVRTKVLDEQWTQVDIQDTGTGISPDVLNKMFSPFYTTKARGTGLGLAVVKKAMGRMGGKVEAFSEVGKGTLFRLYIPRQPEANRTP